MNIILRRRPLKADHASPLHATGHLHATAATLTIGAPKSHFLCQPSEHWAAAIAHERMWCRRFGVTMSLMRKTNKTRPEILANGPMHFAPTNELGVVFLFSHLASKLGFRIEEIRSGYPDCIAYRKVGGAERRVRIEFEYRSSNFSAHRHCAQKCDAIVCWEHDWPDVPDRIRVIELSRQFGMGFKVWIQPVIKSQWRNLIHDEMSWGLSKRAHPGDLLLMYRCHPDAKIEDIFTLISDLKRAKAGWRKGECYCGNIRRVCRLENPIEIAKMRDDRFWKTASFIRRNMQGNLQITEYWPELCQMIVAQNPTIATAVRYFALDPVHA